MESLCTHVDHKRKSEGKDFYDAQRECKYAKLEAQRAAVYTYFTHLWHEWLSRDLVKQDASNFRQSGAPLRFMYFDMGQWKDYVKDVTSALMVCFIAGKSSASFLVNGKVYLVDFVHMLQLNTQTGSVRSVAWMDQTGKCFTPSKCLEGHVQDFFSVRPHPSDGGSICHAGSSTCQGLDFTHLGDKLTKVAEDDQDFTFVKEKFLSGLASLSKHTLVTGVYRSCYSGTLGQVRLQTFKGQEQATGEARGDANVHYAWHGTSKKGISGIIQHGFGQPRVPKHGVVYGVGVYLAPEDCSLISALYSDVDENGEQYMLLCKVIMGRTEQVHPGSEQFHPSNEEYDTGVDDLGNPRRYIVWSTHMNTHILPHFVISFKLEHSLRAVILAGQRRKQFLRPVSACRQSSRDALVESKETDLSTKVEAVCLSPPNKQQSGACTNDSSTKACNRKPCISTQRGSTNSAVVDSHKAPQSPWISFPDLLSMVEPKLNSNALSTLQELYCEFQIGRLPRILLVKVIRCVVGDVILRECLDSKSVKAVLSCSAEAICMDKDSRSSFTSQSYT